MKRCPTCHLPFSYELLNFCRFDGSRLVSVSREEAPTLLLSDQQISDRSVQGEAHAEDSSNRQMTAL